MKAIPTVVACEKFVGALIGDAPKGFALIKSWGDGFAYQQIAGGLRVIVDAEVKADGNRWLHVSVSRKDWTPSHEDMALIKAAFVGERYAYSVWSPSDLHVNIHAHCLHLWALLDDSDGRVLPEFSAIIDGLGRSI